MATIDGDFLCALAPATEIHDGHVVKAGRPYLGHPIRMARYVAAMAADMARPDDSSFSDFEQILRGAILHDAREGLIEAQARMMAPPL